MRRAVSTVVGLATRLSSALASTGSTATGVERRVESPAAGVIFNNPTGTPAQQVAIMAQINRAIDAAPRGSVIRMAQYRFDINSMADKLIAAHRRGVNVRVLIDDGYLTAQHKRVRAVIGTNETRPSFVTTCKQSCTSDAPSVMHAKFFLFSAAGDSRLVSMISSANPYRDNTYTSWNNIHTLVGNAVVYNSLTRYFGDLLKDRTNLNYYRTTSAGQFKLYKFPRAARPGTNTMLLLDVLKGTRLNDEPFLRVKDDSTVDAYHRNFDAIRDGHSRRLTRSS